MTGRMVAGDGNRLTDESGELWTDMLSGILNVSFGHGSNTVQMALDDVSWAGLINTYDRPSAQCQKLKDRLADYWPGYSWQLLNTGAEAIERAIQVACVNLGRRAVVAVLPESFHGKSITMAGIRYDVPWGNPFDVITLTGPDDDRHFDVLIYEPIRGWDGKQNDESVLAAMCAQRGAMLVADEMITGFLRCGQRFLSKTADMIISGKGLAQGLPLAVLGISNRLAQSIPIGWNTTAGGNNLCSTVGNAVLDQLMERERELQTSVWNIHTELSGTYTMNGALGFLKHDRDPAKVRAVFEQERMIVSWHEQFIRIAPSFITSRQELTQLLDITRRALCQ